MIDIMATKKPGIVSPKGFQACGIHAGLKRKRKDLALLVCERPASTAAVYTTNHFQAAPIQVTKASLAESNGYIRAVLINSGNANACTGEQGLTDAYTMRDVTATQLGVKPEEVAVASTGVIGQPLPMTPLVNGIGHLQPTDAWEGGQSFAEAILTTDTGTKQTSIQYEEGEVTVTIAGVAKGSGMIHPNMATMLGFVTTDAVISPELLQQTLKKSVDASFNNITVDGDSSTNDMVLVMASGALEMEEIKEGTSAHEAFQQALTEVCLDLAKAIAKDGEGATKLIEVHVSGATSDQEARTIAKQIVGSSLVKTAVYGQDANWGRMIAAIGAVPFPVNVGAIDLHIGSQLVLQNSTPVWFDETYATEEMSRDVVTITVDLNDGEGSGQAYGCDLTYDYVKINASYRT
ncbi:bifunctional glutamate N-acetyltransferase/amino-acid acetyltransferase ArgJ [Exiguobacterium sp. MMG028]|uniref:bifunctional glutamate N-acetyltransferase/amino-acid acetyltransferase ArgJ n=1 Tax=Exiguobacterium sp. MMG028 TaxID=3021979 RepID=UPI0022FECC4A|nr:bifunctional glutamate N-acetyltransferase/amino-acid acetyltransferase ArgJ [Exiguobacterium sp. MMG028]MDA5561491.1 bifunctional glutamate N-acetyltransferase/amino-acid acetyltransferase ArgJ [Exiguobacterium sp. MMG028]